MNNLSSSLLTLWSVCLVISIDLIALIENILVLIVAILVARLLITQASLELVLDATVVLRTALEAVGAGRACRGATIVLFSGSYERCRLS